jgi:hypothetical protein
MNAMNAITQTTVTEGQRKQIDRFLEDTFETVKNEALAFTFTTKEGAQRFLEQGDDFIATLRATTTNNLRELSVTNKYANEEVTSRYGYLSGYKPGVQDLDRRIARLQELFLGLGGANPEYLEQVKSGKVALPECAEKFGAVPNWKKRPDLFGAIYNDALVTVLGTIKETRGGKFYNYREGQLGQERLRQSARSVGFWNRLIEEQGNPDILIVPFQFGLRHRGRSTRRANEVMIGTLGEFGLGAFAVGCLLLTHEERLQNFDDLWIDAPGDEFDDPDSDVRFGRAPCFGFDGGEVGFGASAVGSASEDYGSVSGVVPQK